VNPRNGKWVRLFSSLVSDIIASGSSPGTLGETSFRCALRAMFAESLATIPPQAPWCACTLPRVGRICSLASDLRATYGVAVRRQSWRKE